jgi:hypothetical protein
MSNYLQLTEVINPLAQTFRVVQKHGAVLTGIGLFFSSKTAGSNPITVELRPVDEGGSPSAKFVYPGTRVSLAPASVNVVANFDGSTGETKFTFPEPFHVPENSEVAIVIHTNAAAGDYKIWIAEMGEYFFNSTERKIISQPEAGSFFASSNGTSWTAEQSKDIAFKVYKANFSTGTHTAVLNPDVPPLRKIASDPALENPLFFTAASSSVKVLHPYHGFQPSDRVSIYGLDSAARYAGVLGSSIMGDRQLTAVDPYGYTFAMDSAADSAVRAGGINILATEQYVVDEARLILPKTTPVTTSIATVGDFTTTKSFAGTEEAYQTSSNLRLPLGEAGVFREPHVVASELQETNRLSGNPSTSIKVRMNVTDANVAPYFNVAEAAFEVGSNLIDYQDSASTAGRNVLSTIDFVAETAAFGGTTFAKHLTIPYSVLETATTLKILVDANRPAGTDFDIWYRTASLDDTTTPISNKEWIVVSKTPTAPNRSNYSDLPTDDDPKVFREYSFELFDVPDFTQYQLKITMNSQKSTRIPRFRNLRTIATE